jgi:hypothetical protein
LDDPQPAIQHKSFDKSCVALIGGIKSSGKQKALGPKQSPRALIIISGHIGGFPRQNEYFLQIASSEDDRPAGENQPAEKRTPRVGRPSDRRAEAGPECQPAGRTFSKNRPAERPANAMVCPELSRP